MKEVPLKTTRASTLASFWARAKHKTPFNAVFSTNHLGHRKNMSYKPKMLLSWYVDSSKRLMSLEDCKVMWIFLNDIPRPSKVCFWWLRSPNFKPLEDSGFSYCKNISSDSVFESSQLVTSIIHHGHQPNELSINIRDIKQWEKGSLQSQLFGESPICHIVQEERHWRVPYILRSLAAIFFWCPSRLRFPWLVLHVVPQVRVVHHRFQYKLRQGVLAIETR